MDKVRFVFVFFLTISNTFFPPNEQQSIYYEKNLNREKKRQKDRKTERQKDRTIKR